MMRVDDPGQFVHLLEHAPLFQDNVEPVPTIRPGDAG